jgi:hypothetical protein
MAGVIHVHIDHSLRGLAALAAHIIAIDDTAEDADAEIADAVEPGWLAVAATKDLR